MIRGSGGVAQGGGGGGGGELRPMMNPSCVHQAAAGTTTLVHQDGGWPLLDEVLFHHQTALQSTRRRVGVGREE